MLLALGAVAVVCLLPFDPIAGAMLFDLEFLTVLGSVGLMLLRGDGRLAAHWLGSSHAATMVRAGVHLTRRRWRSLLR